MEIYNHNIEALKNNMPILYVNIEDELVEYEYDDSVCSFDTARNGSVYMMYEQDGEVVRLNSNYNPEREAEQWAKQYTFQEYSSNVVMYGLGTGVFAKALTERMGDKDHLVIYEPDMQVFVNILHKIDITDIITNDKIVIVAGKDIYKLLFTHLVLSVHWANLDTFSVIAHPGYDKFLPDRYINYNEEVANIKMVIRSEGLTEENFGDDFAHNSIKNIKHIKDSAYFYEFVDAFPEKTVGIMVAAGPSLDKNIKVLHKLKEKAVIIAVDTALKSLNKEGIVPDFCASVDPRKPINYFDDTNFEYIPMFCRLDSNPEVLARHQGKKIWFDPTLFHALCYDYAGIPHDNSVSTGGSVATSSFILCKMLGLKTIVIIGQDLAYSGGVTHAGGMVDAPESEEKKYVYVKGNVEDTVKTRPDWYMYLKWYERTMTSMPEDIRVINATEGGAYIEGMEVMTLQEVADELCTKDVGISGIISEILNKDHAEFEPKIKEFFEQCVKDAGIMKKKLEKAISLCNKFDRRYKKTRTLTPEVTKYMKDISNINKAVADMPVYSLIDEMVKNKDLNSIKEIYSSGEDEFSTNIHMIANAKHLFELSRQSVDEIYEELKEAVEEL